MKSADHLRLRVLGPASIEGSGSDAAGVLGQPKRLAILTYLAVQGGFVRRDQLVTMFWPDVERDRARRALSQSIHYLRRALGKDVIRGRGVEELGISPDVIPSDVRAFEAAIAGSRWEEAVDLYRGELLHGMNGDHSPEFAHWLDGVRTHLRRAAGEAAGTLSAAYFRNGDLAAAIHWQRRAVQIRPLDEAVLRDYLMLLDEAGNGALALREYDSFRARLAEEYQLEPARETVKLIGMIRSRRPDMASAVATSSGQESERSTDVMLVTPALPAMAVTRKGRRGWYIAPAMAGAIVVLLTVFVPLFNNPGSATPVVVHNRVAVLHFQTAEDDSLDYLALGLTTALTDYLHGFEALDIVPNHAVARFRYWNAPTDSIRSALKTRFLIFGNMSRVGAVTKVTIELIDAITQSTLTHRTLPFAGMDGSAIIDSVMVVVAAELSSELEEQLERYRYEWGSSNPEAKEYALRAAGLADQAEEYARTDDFSLALAATAKADAALDQAIRNDRSWAQPHILRARIAWIRAFICLDPDCDPTEYFSQAAAHAKRAVDLDPGNASALELRADIVWKMWMFGIERDTAALNRAYEDARNAVLIDQTRALAWSIQSAVAHERGDYELALKRGLTALEKDEFSADRDLILDNVFDAAFNLGDDSIASEMCAKLRRPAMTLRAAACDLQLRAWSPGREADVDEAWSIVHALEDATKGPFWDANRTTAHLLVAAVIAAAGQQNPVLADSARRLIERETKVSSDGSSLLLAAAAHARSGDDDQARSLLRQHVADNPNSMGHISGLRWFKSLDTDGTGVSLNVPHESSGSTASVFPEGPPRSR